MIIDRNQLKYLFEEAKSRYKALDDVNISLRFSNGWFFTMQALIEPRSMLRKKRKYYVRINLKRTDIISKLSKDDILGWFGHEFAHVVEYEKMSNSKLFLFILRYIFDIKFRFFVERRVNVFAFNNGFAKELVGVGKKFLSVYSANSKYRKYIENYFPRWEDIKEVAQNQGLNKQEYESFKIIS